MSRRTMPSSAAKESVNARVAGEVVEIAVLDNQRVQRGQLLFKIDPEPYQIAIDQAEARRGTARLQIDALKATYRQQLAELQSARDSEDFDEREYGRQKALVTDGWTPREVFDRADKDLKVARQHITSEEQQIANTVAALDGDPNFEIDRHPTVRRQGSTGSGPAQSILRDGGGTGRWHCDTRR
jgi:membrane fusion protein (multidrug efflux system)